MSSNGSPSGEQDQVDFGFQAVARGEKAGMVREGPPFARAVFPNIGGAPRECCTYSLVREFPRGHEAAPARKR